MPKSSEKRKTAVKKKIGSEKSKKSKEKTKATSPKAKAPAKAKARTAAKAKAKAPAKARSKKAAAPKKRKVSIKALLSKRFDTGVMDKLAAQGPYKAKASIKIPESPPFVSGQSKKQIEQVRALLFKSFDLKEKAPAKKTKASKAKAPAAMKAKAPAKAKARTAAKAKAPAKAKAKAKAPAKARSKKAAAPKKRKVSIKALLSKRFDTGVMDKLAAQGPYKAKASIKIPESPPFVSEKSKKQIEQVRALLFKSFDLKEKAPAKKTKASKAKAPAATKAKAPAKARSKKAAAPKKRKVSIKALLSKRFDTGVMDKLAAQSPYKAKASIKIPESPPFVSGKSKKQVEQVRALLFKTFDLTAPPEIEDSGHIPPVEEAFQAPVPPAAVLSQPKESAGLAVKLGLSGLAILMAIVIATSLSNRRSFFLKEVGGTVQVWQGKFAPTGSELILSLEGMKLSNPIRDVYSKSEVYRLAFDHFQGKADALLYDSMEPDFSKINNYLRQSATYAPTGVERTMARRRLDSIALLILFHRIDVALIKGTLPDLEAAKASLEKGTGYASSEYQRDLIAKRKAVLDSAITQLSK